MRSKLILTHTLLGILWMAAAIAAQPVDVITQLIPLDGASGDKFGTSVALTDSTVIVGAPYDSDAGLESGSAYLFDAVSGVQIAKLVALGATDVEHFGCAVGIDGTTAVVGTPGDEHNGFFSGSVYVFDAVTGEQLAELLPLDGEARNNFGAAVAISGTQVIVGAPSDDDNGLLSGSAYIFDVLSGTQMAKLTASNGSIGDSFGTSVAIFGTTAVVGAPYHTFAATNSGEAYLFDVVTGNQVSMMVPADGANKALFGYSVGVSNAAVIAGAYQDDDNGNGSGSAYFFDPNTGVERTKLLPSDNQSGDNLGYSVAVSGTIGIAGAYLDKDNGSGTGSAYLFDSHTGLEIEELHSPAGTVGEWFGYSVAIRGNKVVVSALLGGANGISSGTAYVFYLADNVLPASTTVRNGSGSNALLLSGVTDPALGLNWDTDVDASGHVPSLLSLVAFSDPSGGSFLASGEILLDLSSALVSSQTLMHQGDSVRFSSPVPFDGSLFGFTASAQAIVFGSPGVELSNALDLVVGY